MDAAKLRQILEHQQHGDLLESETTSDEAEHVAPSGGPVFELCRARRFQLCLRGRGSVEDALLHLQELSGVEVDVWRTYQEWKLLRHVETWSMPKLLSLQDQLHRALAHLLHKLHGILALATLSY